MNNLTPMNDDGLQREVLQLVNVAREATMRRPLEELPIGHRLDCERCVLARALVANVDDGEAWFATIVEAEAVARAWRVRRLDHQHYEVTLPIYLRDFMARFDGGAFNHLAEADDGDDSDEGGANDEDDNEQGQSEAAAG